MNKKFIFVWFLFGAYHSFAQLATWEFSALNGDETGPFAASSLATHITTGSLDRGSGLQTNAAGGSVNSKDWTTTNSQSTAESNGDYYIFYVTVESGYTASISDIKIALRRSTSGPSNMELRSSKDSYGSTIGNIVSPPSGSTSTQYTFIPTGGINNFTGTLTFKLYGYNASGNTGTGRIGSFTGSDLIINGSTCGAPSSQATGVAIIAGPVANSLTVSFSRGNGDNVIVLAKDGSSVDSDPVDGTSYTANSIFGTGSQIGAGNYVVYKGTGTSVTVTGLTNGHTYFFAVYEFNSSCNYYKKPAATSSALPIELTDFRAKSFDKNTILYFSTATEQDNDYFSIERSANGQSYHEIGQVKGAGTSYEPKDYTFTDERPLPGKNYYRLRQVDFDGKFSYSPVVTAVFGSARTLTLAPVPANESLSLQLEKGFEQDGTWQVFDMNGRQLLDGKLPAETKEKALDVSSLPEGAYVLRLNVGQEVFVEQFRKQ